MLPCICCLLFLPTASLEIAKKEGPYPTFKGSPASEGKLQFDLWGVKPSDRYDWAALKEEVKTYGLRNSLLVAPMPTASTAQILGNTESFEPITSNIYNRRVLAGEFAVINKYLLKVIDVAISIAPWAINAHACCPCLQDLIKLGLWNQDMRNRIIAERGSVQTIESIPQEIRDLYKTVWEMKQKVLIDLAADRGAFICQSQSLNLYLARKLHSLLLSQSRIINASSF